MYNRMIKFLRPPVFEDDGDMRRAEIVNIILVSGILLSGVDAFGTSLAVQQFGTPMFARIIVFFTLIFLWTRLKRGDINTATYGTVTILWLLFAAFIYLFGGIRSASMALIGITILIAAILTSRVFTIFLSILTAVYGIFLLYLHGQYMIPPSMVPISPFSIIRVYLIVWVITAITLLKHNNALAQIIEKSTTASRDIEQTAQELESIRSTQEAIIKERTDILERRARFIEAAADVGRAATSIYALDELLPQVVQFISERFGFYHVGIFLIDDFGEYAELRASNSEGGKRMVARGHKLRVGEEGIVGYVTGTGEARIALDVGEEPVHFSNPELPGTRSEMALPLFSGGRIFGALDVQSRDASAFINEDIAALRVLADQVSMAINNALLFEQLQESVEAERRAYGEVTRRSWRQLLSYRRELGYRFANQVISNSSGAWTPLMLNAAKEKRPVQGMEDTLPTLAVPVMIGFETIGVMRLRKKTGQTVWTDDEIDLVAALTGRLSQALESARLYQETQTRAAQEQITSEISTNIRQTLDIDAVLRTAVQEFGETFNAREVIIRVNPQEEN